MKVAARNWVSKVEGLLSHLTVFYHHPLPPATPCLVSLQDKAGS